MDPGLLLVAGARVREGALPTHPGRSSAQVLACLQQAFLPPVLAALAPVAAGRPVTVILSDASREEPRAAFLAALAPALAPYRVTLAIATGTHAATSIEALGLGVLPPWVVHVMWNDGHTEEGRTDFGTTGYGTRVRLASCVASADVVIATGCIRPHYFAGYSAGAKAIFPGLGYHQDIRHNHRLKAAPGAVAGALDDNPCRADLEAAVARVPTPIVLCNAVVDAAGTVVDAVAGHVRTAHRAGCALAERWYRLDVAPAPLVIAYDQPPVTRSLYQAAKLFAGALPWVMPGGQLWVVAGCEDGLGASLALLQEAIFATGVWPRCPPGAQLGLCSRLDPADVKALGLHPRAWSSRLDVGQAPDVLVLRHAAASVPPGR